MQIGLILKVIPLKLFLDHNRLHKPQYSLEIANRVTRILLTWTAQAALGSISFHPRNHLLNARGNIYSRSEYHI